MINHVYQLALKGQVTPKNVNTVIEEDIMFQNMAKTYF